VQDYFEGTGMMTAGDLWWGLMPAVKGPYTGSGSEAGDYMTAGIRQFIRFGNFDRNWSVPGGNYPIAYTWNYWWSQYLHVMVFDPDPNFNPVQINGVNNPSYYASDYGYGTENLTNYAMVTYKSTLNGANDKNRTFAKEAYWVDPTKRHHLVYEAGWVTNVGLDVKIRAHQFSGPNWNNLNDFVIVEISLKNTGNVDMNMDGVYEKTNHKIPAIAFHHSGEFSPVTSADISGRRGSSWAPARDVGYIGDADPDGSPWNFNFGFNGNEIVNPTAGHNNLGLAPFTYKWYTDLWSGFTWIGAKKGSIPSDISKGTGQYIDKPLLWNTPAIGTSAQRGWYVSSGTEQSLVATSYIRPKSNFINAVSTYFKNGGKDLDKTKMDFNPNPNFFQSGTKGDVTTFVPKTITPTAAERPNGDRKLLSEEGSGLGAFYQITENGTMDKGVPYPTGWGKLSKGFSRQYNWDGELYQGLGPFALDVGEEMTVTLLLSAGFRLEGMQKAVRAGRWAYDNNYSVPEPPPVPEIIVTNSPRKSILIEWDNRAENDLLFSGYKVWRAAQLQKYDWLRDGMRIIDKYQEQMIPGEDKAAYRKPINPMFDAFDEVTGSSTKGQYAGYTFGTYELVKTIPKAELATYAKSTKTGYKYLYEDNDKNVIAMGASYWYYISAYKDGLFTGPKGETTNRIETHSINRNGATGLWEKTWPFATSNSFFPTTFSGKKAIGAADILLSSVVETSELNSGVYKIGVRPNPYKRASILTDNFTNVYDHKIIFFNLPQKCKIVITDVAGKIIQIINFVASSPSEGSVFWDMFSKDGMEAASGLYLYYVEWDGGSNKGKFAILR
jgi:hypothetical protein